MEQKVKVENIINIEHGLLKDSTIGTIAKIIKYFMSPLIESVYEQNGVLFRYFVTLEVVYDNTESETDDTTIS